MKLDELHTARQKNLKMHKKSEIVRRLALLRQSKWRRETNEEVLVKGRVQIENIVSNDPNIKFKEVLVSNKLENYDFLGNIHARRILRVDPKILYHIAYHDKPLRSGPNATDGCIDDEILSDPTIGDSLMVGTLPKPLQDLPKEINVALCLNDVIFPDNVGVLLQSAHAVGGVDAIIGTEKTCDFYGWKVLEASRGYGYNIPKKVMSTPEELQTFISERNLLPIVGDCSEGETFASIDPRKYSGVVIIVGNEKHGPTQSIRDMAVKIRIPIKIHSLNVGVAGGILLQMAKSAFAHRSVSN